MIPILISSQGILLFSIFSKIFLTEFALKGGIPTINSNKITPTLHQSIIKLFKPYPYNISGAFFKIFLKK